MKGQTVKSFRRYPYVLAVFSGDKLIHWKRFRSIEDLKDWVKKVKGKYQDGEFEVIMCQDLRNFLYIDRLFEKYYWKVLQYLEVDVNDV